MKTFFAVLCLASLAATQVEAIRTNELISAVMNQQGDNTLFQSFSSLLGQEDKPIEKQRAYALIKYIVVPSKAKEFIKQIESTKKAAEKFDGYITYNLVKPVDDNISYIAWAAWETVNDLISFLKSSAAEDLIRFTAEEDIVTQVTSVKPIV